MSSRLFRSFLIVGFFGWAIASQAQQQQALPELAIYTYDSFVAKGGLGPEIFPLFEKSCGCKLKILPSGDGGQLVSRLQIDAERGKPGAQLVIGLDEASFDRAKAWLEDWKRWRPKGYRDLHPDLPKTPGFLPFDYGFFAFMADEQALREAKLTAPESLSTLLEPNWKRNVILQDPRTSTPGLAFVLYADTVFKSDPTTFWKKMRTQWLTLALGWDSAYGLFLKKEAPLVWSYTTSQAYHEEHGDSALRRYRALLFKEGQPMQIEGAALVRGSFGDDADGKRKLAESFLEFLISPEVQKIVPRKQWMYPARKNIELPPSFKNVPRPKKIVRIPAQATEVNAALNRWTKAVEGSR